MGAFLAAAMMGAFSAGPALADAAPKVMQVPAKATKPGKRGLFNDAVLPKGHSLYGRKGAGIGMAAQQRASGKRRNVKRNRAAHRG
jgi:hypothetical protein